MHCTSNRERYYIVLETPEEFSLFYLHYGASNIPCDVMVTLCGENEMRNAYIISFVERGVTYDITYNCKKFNKS